MLKQALTHQSVDSGQGDLTRHNSDSVSDSNHALLVDLAKKPHSKAGQAISTGVEPDIDQYSEGFAGSSRPLRRRDSSLEASEGPKLVRRGPGGRDSGDNRDGGQAQGGKLFGWLKPGRRSQERSSDRVGRSSGNRRSDAETQLRSDLYSINYYNQGTSQENPAYEWSPLLSVTSKDLEEYYRQHGGVYHRKTERDRESSSQLDSAGPEPGKGRDDASELGGKYSDGRDDHVKMAEPPHEEYRNFLEKYLNPAQKKMGQPVTGPVYKGDSSGKKHRDSGKKAKESIQQKSSYDSYSKVSQRGQPSESQALFTDQTSSSRRGGQAPFAQESQTYKRDKERPEKQQTRKETIENLAGQADRKTSSEPSFGSWLSQTGQSLRRAVARLSPKEAEEFQARSKKADKKKTADPQKSPKPRKPKPLRSTSPTYEGELTPEPRPGSKQQEQWQKDMASRYWR